MKQTALLGVATSMMLAPLAIFGLGQANAEGDVPLPVSHQTFNPSTSFGQVSGRAASPGVGHTPSGAICTAAGYDGLNRRTDCEGNSPDNEPSIATNPTRIGNLIAGGNDYQLTVTAGHTYVTALSRAMVSFDRGNTWTTYSIPFNAYSFTGDPAIAFDDAGRAYYATLGFRYSQGFSPTGTTADVVVSHSTTGGKTWTRPVRVAAGTGSFGSVGRFNDKEYITAWGDGNAMVTYTEFRDGRGGSYLSSPIYSTVTHDGGNTWTTPVQISGSAAFCIGSGQQDSNSCDQDQVSVPTVGAGNRIFVAFENGPRPGSTDYDDQYLVVQVDPATGRRIAGPFRAATLQDGVADYPVNVDGRQTYQDSQFRTWSAGNITADPTRRGHLAVTFSDMRNSPSVDSGQTDPYTTVTNSDVFVVESNDGGQTWTTPARVGTGSNDQFFPWAAYSPSGQLGVTYSDRSYDPANHQYGQTLATETAAGAFATRQVTTELSDPTKNDRWFSGGVPNNATTFLGDYNNLAYDRGGAAHPIWTDMRQSVTFTSRTGFDEQLATARLGG